MKALLLSFFLVHALFYTTALAETASPLQQVKPEKVGMDPKKLGLVDQKIEELIKEGRLAGGIVVVARKGKVVHFGTYGKRDLENDFPVEKDTVMLAVLDMDLVMVIQLTVGQLSLTWVMDMEVRGAMVRQDTFQMGMG